MDINDIITIAGWMLAGVCTWGHTHSVLDTVTVVAVVFALTPWNPRTR